jgi:hypothetical protein
MPGVLALEDLAVPAVRGRPVSGSTQTGMIAVLAHFDAVSRPT